MRLESRMIRLINEYKGLVVLRSEFSSMGNYSQIGRILSSLVSKGVLVRVSRGAYAKARINQYTGQPTPAGTLEMIVAELFQKLDITISPSALVVEYNSGKSSQIPMGAVINTGRRRISRKVVVGNNALVYEHASTK